MNIDTSGNKAAGKGNKTEKVSFKMPEKARSPIRLTKGINKLLSKIEDVLRDRLLE
jgi:hypothetical protein